MSRPARWLRALLAYGMPAYLAMLVTIAVQGAAMPWPAARAILERHGDQIPVMVGIATQTRRSPARGLETAKSRFYVLVPGVLSDPRLLRITQVDGGPATESASHAGFWALLAAVAACLAGTWWFWLRPARGVDPDAGVSRT